MTLAARRKQELTFKIENLRDQIETWEQRTIDEEPMRRHFSQVRRIGATLEGLLESMKTSTGWNDPTDETVLAKSALWERRVLTAHAIWEVFRGKLAQRFDASIQRPLMACDDLAWACYEPAMKRFSAATSKEPSLVYLNSTWSAFLRRRDSSFEKEVDVGKDARDVLTEADYQAILKRLPIPFLGLPWFQVAHLPSALLIAHEIGHGIEFDFDLTTALDTALQKANLQFLEDWRGCKSEVFADLYGCLCLGEQFASALLDLLVGDKAAVSTENEFTVYPTRAFRVELAVEALRFLGDDGAADRIRRTWQSAYGDLQTLTDRRPDVEKVVAAVYSPSGMDLASMIRPPDARTVAILAQAAAFNASAKLADTSDARELFCALRLAYEQTPEKSHLASALLVQQVLNTHQAAFRGGLRDLQPPPPTPTENDFESGKALARHLGFDEE